MSEQERRVVLHRRLVLAKEMYLQGEQLARQRDEISRMLAIHSLHNAVEMTLRVVMTSAQLTIPGPPHTWGFTKVFEKVDKAAGAIPEKDRIAALNQRRAAVQHDAHVPSAGEMDEWRVFVRAFMVSSFTKYFGEEFERISRLALVEDSQLRTIIELAQQSLKRGAANLACGQVHSAMRYTFYSLGIHRGSQPFPNPMFVTIEAGGAIDFGPIFANHEHAINANAQLVQLLATGVNLVSYQRFQALPVDVTIGGDGTPSWRSTASDAPNEEVEWAIQFLIDTLIRWQLQGLKVCVPEAFHEGCDKAMGKWKAGQP